MFEFECEVANVWGDVKGKLGKNLHFSDEIGADIVIFDSIEICHFQNNCSAFQNSDDVQDAINDLLSFTICYPNDVLEILKQRHWCCSDAFIVNFEHVSNLFLVFLLLTLKK